MDFSCNIKQYFSDPADIFFICNTDIHINSSDWKIGNICHFAFNDGFVGDADQFIVECAQA